MNTCVKICLILGALSAVLSGTEQSSLNNLKSDRDWEDWNEWEEEEAETVEGAGDSNQNNSGTGTGTGIGKDPKHPDLMTDVPFVDCGSEHASLFQLFVDPPCGANNCTLIRGEPSTLGASFMPRLNSSTLRVRVDRIDPIFGWPTILIPEFKACGERFNVTCPIVENEAQYANVTAIFPKSIPPMTIQIKVTVLTEKSDVYFCLVGNVVLA